jgi:DNA-directed RNA polymerase specialized sigma24 family protein
MGNLGAALARLESRDRALLELSTRRGLADEEVAESLGLDAAGVTRRRAELLTRLDEELRLDGREERDELRATLPDLPDGPWQGG